ncbi:hypothetical protein HK104_006356 [Borealophlyctis nickersoniae]|nr:hypothetical protein HK104_006356 [Borealophlyctis nickersoniae]
MSRSSKLIFAYCEPGLVDKESRSIKKVWIHLDDIKLSAEDNIVRKTKEHGVKHMQEQLTSRGYDVQMPITVRNRRDTPFVIADEPGHNELEVIEGWHRVTAAKRAGTIPSLMGAVVKKDILKVLLILIGAGQNLSHEDKVKMSFGDYLEAIRGIHMFWEHRNPNKANYSNCTNAGAEHVFYQGMQGKKKQTKAGTATLQDTAEEAPGIKKKGLTYTKFGHYHNVAMIPKQPFDLIVEDQALPKQLQAFSYENVYADAATRHFCTYSGQANAENWMTYLSARQAHYDKHGKSATRAEAVALLSVLQWRENLVDNVLPNLTLPDGSPVDEDELRGHMASIWKGEMDHLTHEEIISTILKTTPAAGEEGETSLAGFKLPRGGQKFWEVWSTIFPDG